jgi:oligoendopeptidase F
MISSYPKTAQEFTSLSWGKIEPYYRELAERPIDASNVSAWLADWTYLCRLVYETHERLYVAITVNTADSDAEQRYNAFLDGIRPASQAADQVLKEKLLSSGLRPQGFEVALRNMMAEAQIFRQENLPLLSEDLKLGAEYSKIVGAQTVDWQGEEVTLTQLSPVYLETDREMRQRAWRLASDRWLADREAINAVWARLLGVRRQLAANAGMPDYRAYRWRQLLRFDYTPEDCKQFHRAIEQVAVPAARRIYEKRRQRLGVGTLRPWDLDVDPLGRPPLKPYETVSELKEKTATIFHRVDPQLGKYFEIMRRENFLDLDNRKNKAPGGYCTDFPIAGRPFIFANSVGLHDDVQTLLHEGGHAFHFFECFRIPYFQQSYAPTEFMEVASMGMELLGSPYLTRQEGGFYSAQEAARARIEHLEGCIRFWPYMAVVDAFQHWVYENPQAATDPANCDACWDDLWGRFMPGVDWSGLEQERMTGWHRKLHIHEVPFYYVEYGLAQLGAAQVWQRALTDQAGAVAAYRRALALGNTVTLPELFAVAGARFAFDEGMLGEAVALMERTIDSLERL